ncbi:hypothetical protein [Acidicapsa acidisoli]|uniref:hypothetical protein n=1 Tax=Acidicapsa acidisoli TaxID=1615681 RepID=UPI0021DFB232|nr:hypothetical protein [Acidicapsa acidisoli]
MLIVLSLLAGVARAQAGPPFRTDDPETPGSKQWEINFGWLGDRNSTEGSYSIPDFDINYGLGNRIQLKYELPIAIHEVLANPGNETGAPPSIDIDLGESLLGVKWRFYEHIPASVASDTEDEETPESNFSFSTYPQLSIQYPTTRTSQDGLVGGPQFLLPLEANARIGPFRVDGEAGYWFTDRSVPQSWIRGVIVGREFTRKTEAYIELYDQQDANRVNGLAKKREATLGPGGRHSLNRNNTVLLLLMAGRSFQKIAPANAQPNWIGYAGLQLLLGPRQRTGQIER